MHVKSLENQARFFKGFGDTSRLLIVEKLIDGEKTVGDLVKSTGLSQSNTSMHLACMLTCGIVERSRNGRQAIYRLANNDIKELIFLMRKIVTEHANTTADCVHGITFS